MTWVAFMSTALFWFRTDLRLQDNPGLYEAMHNHDKVILLYIADDSIGAAQKWWLYHSLQALQDALMAKGSHLVLSLNTPQIAIDKLIKTHQITDIYWNRQYSPDAIQRDTALKSLFKAQHLNVHTFNAYLLNEPWVIKNNADLPYKVFTPYWRKASCTLTIPDEKIIVQFKPNPHPDDFPLSTWQLLPEKPNWAVGFEPLWTPGELGAHDRLEHFIDEQLNDYVVNRDIPKHSGTSRLSPHLHFGEISPQQIWRALRTATPQGLNIKSLERYQAELGWREFSYYLLYHFPSLPNKNFNPLFDNFPWHHDKTLLKAWQQGKTGYPIVDAGMRELWQTGYMHNRVRMIVASFLTKDLLIDWQEGARWFYDTLLDADLANNSASWQWVAGTGADAAPYFRIFNPTLQAQKFDPDGAYIKRWVPELSHLSAKDIHIPRSSIVEHDQARHLALQYYQGLK